MRIAICDDEEIIRNKTVELLNQYKLEFNINFELLMFCSGEKLLEYEEIIDIVFMDIEMNGIDGICTTNLLVNKNSKTKVILLSSHVERFKEGYKVKAYRFMTKPIILEEFVEYFTDAIEEVKYNLEFPFRKDGVNVYVNMANILYISAQMGYTEVWTQKDVFRSKISLAIWEEMLDTKLFCHCHKKYIVNVSQIEDITEQILLKNGEKVQVSRRNFTKLKEQFINYDLTHRT